MSLFRAGGPGHRRRLRQADHAPLAVLALLEQLAHLLHFFVLGMDLGRQRMPPANPIGRQLVRLVGQLGMPLDQRLVLGPLPHQLPVHLGQALLHAGLVREELLAVQAPLNLVGLERIAVFGDDRQLVAQPGQIGRDGGQLGLTPASFQLGSLPRLPELLTVEERREYLKYLHDSAIKLTQAVRALTGTHAPADVAPAVDRERRPPDILVADNDPSSRQRIEPFLKRAGYEVVYVENGPRALEKASHLQPLAILIDAQLPPSGAPALVRELRKDPRSRDIPLVLLVAPDAPAVTVADCEVLVKPIDRQQLVQLMVRFDLMADGKVAKKMPANLLVIDDDAQAVSLVKAILKPYNVRVSSVDNARAGIEQALRNKPDLVILDLVMPGVDGFEVIAALRRDKDMSRVPILVHTAKTLTPEDRQRLEGKVESIVEKAEFQPERFLELLLKRGERRKRAA